MHRVLQQSLQTDVANQVRDMLTSVVEEQGTGHRAALANYTVGGKTGTAQRFDTKTSSYLKDEYTSSFIGFFPVEAPKLLIAVVLDAPEGIQHTGGAVAAPVFQRIAEQAAEYLHLTPDRLVADETFSEKILTNSSSDVGIKLAVADTAKNFDEPSSFEFKGRTVREVLAMAQKNGLEVVVKGHGFATGKINQDRNLPKRIQVYFDPLARRKF
jgi:cell division protein FtsI (penicillin-binding protein 3)